MGLGPASMQPSDAICFFPNTYIPFVLRRQGSNASLAYKLIGDCLLDTDEQALFPDKDEDKSPIEGSLPPEIFYSAYGITDAYRISLT
jgi:hypothetical protein